MYRVIIVVNWSEGGGATCSRGTCSYVLASLVDPTTDPYFNVNATNATWPAPPVLNPISTPISMNSSALVDLSTAVVTGATPFTATIGTPSQNAVASLLPNTTQVTVTPAT